jgi:Thiamine pyrophosphate enzyme, central domain
VIRADRLVGRVLAAAGVDAVYGHPYGELPVVPVSDGRVADLLAIAHRRVHGVPAAVCGPHAELRVPVAAELGPAVQGASGAGDPVDVRSPGDLLAAVGLDGSGTGWPCMVLRLHLDPAEPVADTVPAPDAGRDRWSDVADDVVAKVAAATRVAVLVGPGVVSDGAVAELHDLAVAGGLGVVNTWGAKGVFHWKSRHHSATIGLQEDDFTLSGLGEVDLIIASGLDPLESPPPRWQLAPWVEVPPSALGSLAERWSAPGGVPGVPPLRARVADVTQRGWASDIAPLAPSRVTLTYGRCLGDRGMVAADPGTAGFWVARTFATTVLGAVHVPAEAWLHGFAAACAVVARLRRPSRPVLAVVDAPVRDEVLAVAEAAASLGVELPLEAWDVAGGKLDADAHEQRLSRLVMSGDTPVPMAIATSADQMDEIVAAAGPVVAWRG